MILNDIAFLSAMSATVERSTFPNIDWHELASRKYRYWVQMMQR